MTFNSADQREFFGINAAFWTLAIETQFYGLLPVFAFVVYKLVKHPVTAIFCTATIFLFLGLVSRATELQTPAGSGIDGLPMIRFHTVFSFLDLFACGMFVAAIEIAAGASEGLGSRVVGWTAAAGVVLFFGVNRWVAQVGNGDWLIGKDFWYLWSFPFLLCSGVAAVLLAVVRLDGFPTSILSTRALAYVGEASYSIYLFHTLVQLAIFKLVPLNSVGNFTLRTLSWGLISLVPTMFVATFVYKLVEVPFLRVGENL